MFVCVAVCVYYFYNKQMGLLPFLSWASSLSHWPLAGLVTFSSVLNMELQLSLITLALGALCHANIASLSSSLLRESVSHFKL